VKAAAVRTAVGRVGTAMVTRHADRPAVKQTADRLCPVCFQFAGLPCRRIVSAPGARKLRFRGQLLEVHPERLGGQR